MGCDLVHPDDPEHRRARGCLVLADRAERLGRELAEFDVEVARLEAAEVMFGQYAEAMDGGRRDDPVVEPDPAGCCSCRTASRG